MEVELGAGDQGGRHDERCRRGEVARNLDLAEREPLGRAHGDARRPDGDVCAGRLQHALGVVAGRGRLDDRRLAVREEPGEQDRRLDLRARDGQRVVDRVERAPGDRHRQVAVRRLEASAHAAEWLGDPTHRPPRERLVARQLEALTVLSGEDAGDQPDERPGVRAVDRPPRRAQPTEALPEHAERVGAVLVDVHPRARTAAIVASVSAERPKPVTCVSPSQIAPISTERCEIDLSPGTATWPTSRGTGSTRSDPRAAVIRRSPAPPRRRSPAPRAARWRARPRPPPRRASSASRHARSTRGRARSPRR